MYFFHAGVATTFFIVAIQHCLRVLGASGGRISPRGIVGRSLKPSDSPVGTCGIAASGSLAGEQQRLDLVRLHLAEDRAGLDTIPSSEPDSSAVCSWPSSLKGT